MSTKMLLRKKATLSPHFVLAFSVKGNLMLNPKVRVQWNASGPANIGTWTNTRELLFKVSNKVLIRKKRECYLALPSIGINIHPQNKDINPIHSNT